MSHKGCNTLNQQACKIKLHFTGFAHSASVVTILFPRMGGFNLFLMWIFTTCIYHKVVGHFDSLHFI